jgi:RHS repeat-associated protein
VLYYPYGETRYVTGTLTTDYGYTGQRNEAGLGLMDYNARYYDPALGRFVSADTIVPDTENPQNWNRYAYAGNNPVLYVDPTGHMVERIYADGYGRGRASKPLQKEQEADVAPAAEQTPVADVTPGPTVYVQRAPEPPEYGTCTLGVGDRTPEPGKPAFWVNSIDWADPDHPEKIHIEFRVRVYDDENPEDYVLVQIRKGAMYEPDGSVLAGTSDWVVDAFPGVSDTPFNSLHPAGPRWNYREIDGTTFMAFDQPGNYSRDYGPSPIPYSMSLEFRTCVLEIYKAPTSLDYTREQLMADALSCIDWSVNSWLHANGTVTYP